MLVRYGDLVSDYYASPTPNTKLMIWLRGAPGIPGTFTGTEKFWKAGYDIIVPDYYGYCRSGGEFTPQGCVQTALDTKTIFKKGEVLDVFGQTPLSVQYSEFAVIGGSFGGWVAGMLPKFDPELHVIGLFYPQLSFADLGRFEEESNEIFLEQVKQGYAPLYRGLDTSQRQEQFHDALGLTPWNNYEHLKNCKVFLAHGTADTCLHHMRTQEFYDKLCKLNPQGQFKYAEYYGLEHGGTTPFAASEGFLFRLSSLDVRT